LDDLKLIEHNIKQGWDTKAIQTCFTVCNINIIDCVKENKINCVKWLIQHGADINAENLEGQTQLDIAIAQNHSELADLLKAAGAKPSE